jgi:CheY-like chemotaxis protein
MDNLQIVPSTKPALKVAIIDDSFAVRTGLKLILHAFFSVLQTHEATIYSAADGVEGIGYTLVAVPEIIILDTTLPKYSGRDLLVYLVSNQKFATGKIRIIVITDGQNSEEVERLHYLNKQDPEFNLNLVHYLAKAAGLAEGSEKLNQILTDSAVKEGGKLIHTASRAEATALKMRRAYFLPWKALLVLRWLVMMLKQNFRLSWVKLIFVQYPDMNLSQHSSDQKILIWRTYPLTFVSLLMGSIFVTLFFLLIINQFPAMVYAQVYEAVSRR